MNVILRGEDQSWGGGETRSFLAKNDGNLRLLLAVFLSAVQLAAMNCLLFDFAVVSISFMLFVARLVFLNSVSIVRSPCAVIFWLNVEFHFIGTVLTLLGLMPDREQLLSQESVGFAYITGASLLVATCVCYLLTRGVFPATDKHNWSMRIFWPEASERSVLRFLFVGFAILFSASVISFLLGIGQMGAGAAAESRLPFKIGGILNTLRISWAPCFGVLMLDILYEKRIRKAIVWGIGLYMMWLVLEALVRSSRGVVIEQVEVVAIWAVVRGVFHIRAFYGLVLVFVVGVVTAPVITEYRSHRNVGRSVGASLSRSIDTSLDESGGAFGAEAAYFRRNAVWGVNRKFNGGATLAKYYSYMDKSVSHNMIPSVLDNGGSKKFHTQVIDRMPSGIAHSSGSSAMADGYLLYSISGLAVMGAVFLIAVFLVDAQMFGIMTRSPASFTISLVLLMKYFSGGLDELLIAPSFTAIFTLLVIVAGFYFADKVWSKRKSKAALQARRALHGAW